MNPLTDLKRIKQTWLPPKMLERSCPREVSLTRDGKVLYGLSIFLLLGGLAAGLILYITSSQAHEGQSRLAKSGLDATATVVLQYTSGKDPVRYWSEYNYLVGSRVYSGRLSTKRNVSLNLQRDGSLKIRYLPADPHMHIALGFESRLLPYWVSLLVAAGSFAISLLLATMLAQQRRLLADGRLAPAVVTKITHSMDHGKKVIHYVFMELEGKLVEGKSYPQNNPPAVGSILNVMYEPDREHHNHLYPLHFVKLKD
jgi:hypothetical protein